MINVSLSLALDDETPHEVWTSKKPSHKHFRVFGCVAYVHLPKENSGKLDKKDEKCKLISFGTQELRRLCIVEMWY